MSSVKVISNAYEVLSNYLSIYNYSASNRGQQANLSLGNFTVLCSDLPSQTILQIFLKEVKNTASA